MNQIKMNEESNDSNSNIIEESNISKKKRTSLEENTIKSESQDISSVIKSSEFNTNNLNFLNDDDLDRNSQSNEKNRKFSFFEQNMKFKLKINVDYSDIDKQKAEISPKMLFKKRKLEVYDNNNINLEEKINNSNNNLTQTSGSNNQKINAKLKQCFEKYLDFVHSSYFSSFENMCITSSNQLNTILNQSQTTNYEATNNTQDENDELSKTVSSNFKFSSLDLLINPLRQKFPFESWSPYEVALFECCICKYYKSFDMFCRIIKTKSKSDIINFYCYWKQSKYYKVWKNYKNRKHPYKFSKQG